MILQTIFPKHPYEIYDRYNQVMIQTRSNASINVWLALYYVNQFGMWSFQNRMNFREFPLVGEWYYFKMRDAGWRTY